MTLATVFLRSSDPTGLLVWCVIGLAAGIGLFVYGFRLLIRRRLILDTPVSRIRSASLGMVEINGLAVGPYTMVAPITAKPCYYYRTCVWEWKQSGKNKEWVKVAGECMHVPFFLDDNTGRVLVDPRGANLDIHRDFQQEFNGSFFSTRDEAPANVINFLARHGVSTSNKIKVEEYCIKPKNALFVLGTLAENPGLDVAPTPVSDPDGTVISSHGFTMSFSTSFGEAQHFDESSLLQRLAAAANSSQSKVIRVSVQANPASPAGAALQEKITSALLKAGISNPAAWSAAGLASPAVQVSEDQSFAAKPGPPGVPPASASSNPDGFEHHPPVVLMKGANNKTFLISWRSQQEVARSLGWKCTLMIWGGPVLALLSLYVLVSLTHLF